MPPIIKEEKKVEYLELIYDLIFVYIVGRNNSLLHHLENGFVSGGAFLAYLLCTLAVIQIWNFSTFYINLYGRQSVRDHIFLFINMYLLYHMADSIAMQWESSFYRFNIAWALILINLGIQHLIEMRRHRDAPWELLQLKRKAFILFGEALLIGVHILVYSFTGISIIYVPIIFGILLTILSGCINTIIPVDFGHLSERAMLYVVFTFGEMIIVIAEYFNEEITLNNLYFSLMAFLIVVGLLLSYGILYNRVIDKDTITNGVGYMMIHVFLIFALNNISVALEFMRNTNVALIPKTLFLVSSFLLYYTFLLLCGIYSEDHGFSRGFFILMLVIGASFVALMLAFSSLMYVNIAVTVLYVFGIFLLLFFRSRRADA